MPSSRPSPFLVSTLLVACIAGCAATVPGAVRPHVGSTAKQADDPVADDTGRVRVDVTGTMPQRGPNDALVTVVVFSDFQCPFCARVEPTLERLRDTYGADLRVVWRDTPLPFHDHATPAAEAAREAYAQRGDDGFWAMHDLLFANQTALEREDLDRYAATVGLNARRFARAMDGHTHVAAIEADAAAGAALGVTGTPSLFINGRSIVGAQPFESFATIVDDELVRARAAISGGARRRGYYAALMRAAPTAPPPSAPSAAAPSGRPVADPAAIYRVPVGPSDASRGPADALVTIVGFTDFQCPFCNRVLPTLERILSTYGADVRLVVRHNPLSFHENAMPAALAAREAFRQLGSAGFFRMHDLLFANQTTLDRDHLLGFASEIGLEMTAFRAALDEPPGGPLRTLIAADQALATSLGATGTPGFFINGRNLRGAQPYEAFAAVIDEELARARALVAAGTARARVYDTVTASGATAPVYLPTPPGVPAPLPADHVYTIPVPTTAPTLGPARADVTIQIFSDFQCPFCSRVNPTLEAVVARYGDRIRLVWRNYPLPFHDNAMPAAEAAMEAFAQRGNDGFWAMHALLFENQRDLTRETLERLAGEVGLNMARFRTALDTHTHRAAIESDMGAIRTAGAEIGTPSFFIEGRLLQGAQPIEEFIRMIDAALAED